MVSYLGKLSFRHLLTLEALHRTRSMSDTATEVGRTQPAISQQVDAVEDAVGFAVLHHRRGGVHFTARGERLVHEATAFFHAFECSVDRIAQMPDERIRVGIPEDLWVACKTCLAPLTADSIEIKSMTSQAVIRAFNAGDIDVGIAATSRPLEASTRTWRLGLRWAGCEPAPERRRDIRIVSLPHGCLYTGVATNAIERAQLSIERHIMHDSIDEVFCELKNGGVTIMSADLSSSLGCWHDGAGLPPLPKATLNLLVANGGGDQLAWAAKTLAWGMSRVVRRREHHTIPGMLRELGVDLRFYKSA
ncbi:LysR family transcriptional regulator [Rhodovibrio salinarum]|nr:LysR family transcriptional regulator [Rhodovibrio salinarum]